MAIVLNEEWTAYVVGEMHKFRIKNTELANECGYGAPYLSTVLNGKKGFMSDGGAQKTKEHILAALEKIKAERMKDVENVS